MVFLDSQVQAQMHAMPRIARASFERISGLVRSLGIENVSDPYIKHLEGPLYEMRLRDSYGVAFAVNLKVLDEQIVVLAVFPKKSPKTPFRELGYIRLRAKEVT